MIKIFQYVLLFLLVVNGAYGQTGSYSKIGEITDIGGSGYVSSVEAQGNYLFVGGYTYSPTASYIKVYDISTPSAPVLRQTVNLGETKLKKLMLDNNSLYALCEENTVPGLYIYDVSNPLSPRRIAHHDCISDNGTNRCFRPGYGILEKRNDYVLVARSLWGFNLFKMSDASAPVYQDGRSYDFSTVRNLEFLSDTDILFNDGSGLRTINYSNPLSLVITSTSSTEYVDLPGEVENMVVTADKKTAYVYCWGSTRSAIAVVDIPSKSILANIDISAKSALGGAMYLSADEKKLFIGSMEWDIVNRSSMTFVAYYDHANPLKVSNNVLFARHGNRTVQILSSGAPLPAGLSITGYSPSIGIAGTSVTITGTNFSTTPASNLVKFNGVQAIVAASTASTITTSVPPGATTGPISVTVDGKIVTTVNEFVVTSATAPTIATFSPSSGIPGTTVTITGTNFSSTADENILTFNGVQAVVLSATSTSITAKVPVGASTGKITVSVNGELGTSSTNFTVISATAPTITSFSPMSGPSGTMVTITGTNFSTTIPENIVMINGMQVGAISSTQTAIVVEIPPDAETGPFSVMVNGEIAVSSEAFVVIIPVFPTITGFSPLGGEAGTEVIITGTNFAAIGTDNLVAFNGLEAPVLSSTPTMIKVSVPAGASDGPITVTVHGETAISNSSFNVIEGAPSITSIAPDAASTGATVVIHGSNFSVRPADNKVFFNNVAATVSSSTATSITTMVPTGAVSGNVYVIVNGRMSVAGLPFTIEKPSITGFSPSAGPMGSNVEITGVHFSEPSSLTKVYFGETESLITEASDNRVITVVPEGLPFAKMKIKVVVGTAIAVSDAYFEVLNCTPPAQPTIIASNLDTETPLLTSSSSTGNQWLRNGQLIPQETNSTLLIEEPGVYNVLVNKGGCLSALSNHVAIVVTSVSNLERTAKLYPNPAKSYLEVRFQAKGNYQVQVLSPAGGVLSEMGVRNQDAAMIDTQHFRPGLYLLVIRGGRMVSTFKFIKE